MKARDRMAVRVGSILSILLAVWGIAFVTSPLGAIGGAGAAAFGFVFGVLALRGHAWGRWRTIALAGISISSVALLLFLAFLAFFS